ncbi:MAG: peptide deformylase [Candidatus Omnitrophota bacterium]|jgi:peptide deformylase
MSDLKIKIFPEEILRKKAKRIASVTVGEKKDLTEMAKVMYLSGGVGLAAVQVGIDKQLVVIDVGDGLIKMINPSIVKSHGKETAEEGCLSVPGTIVNVRRAKSVTANYLNEDGEVIQLKADGLLARAIQHEIDHLLGKLIIDYINPIEKILVRNRLSKRGK